jgi:hypothetical protein
MRLPGVLLCAGLLAGAAVAGEVAVGDLCLPITAADQATRDGRRRVAGPVERRDAGAGLVEFAGQTAQDAVNAAVDLRLPGCRRVRFPSGVGYVATGLAAYADLENPTATRLAKRHAWLKAYAAAKGELARTLAQLDAVALDEIRVALATAGERVNLTEKSTERLALAAQCLLQGFVVYEVEDDAAAGRVLVSIVATPATRARQRRWGANWRQVATMEQAQEELLAEVRHGIVPPLGGRILIGSDGRTLAFAGFGTSVVRHHADAATARQLTLEAQRQAQLRADRGLLAVLDGDQTTWRAELDEITLAEVQEFVRDDPDDQAAVRVLEESRRVFLGILRQTDDWRSLSEGRLPPAVEHRSWISGDGGCVYAVALYLPAARLPADQAVAGMTGDAPVAPVPAARPDQAVAPGPTGQVTPDRDL